MTSFYKSFIILLWIRLAISTVIGLSYMDPIRQRPLGSKLPGTDPCNPLYWYPKTIPEYCYLKPPVTITVTEKPPLPVPLPVPVPLPIPVPSPLLMPVPQHPGLPMPLPIMPPPPLIVPPPIAPSPIAPPPIAPPPALPVALPPFYAQSPMGPNSPAAHLISYSTNLQPHFPFSYPIHEPQAGLVPGLPGLVTENDGINIMPFSDAYSDLLERHKNKMIRKKLRRIINEFEHYPNSRKYYRNKKFNRMMDL